MMTMSANDAPGVAAAGQTTDRHDAGLGAWPLRPWLYAALGAVIMLTANQLGELRVAGDIYSPPIWAQLLISGLIAGGLVFGITAERVRLAWAVIFAAATGGILMFVGWFTASYNKGGELAEFPFLAGVFAALVAAPLFQTVRDEGAWRFPYARLHGHVWTDAVIGGAAIAFTAICFGLATLISELFDVIGIAFFKDLLRRDWFSTMLAGLAFGGALGLLREQDRLVATLQKLVLTVLSVLAPVLALALGGFLLSLPFTGLGRLWESGVPATPTLLLAAAGGFVLINAVIGDGKADGSRNRLLRISALLLSITVLPLAVIAAVSMGLRIGQYGWTPDRMWGLVAIVVATVYGVAYLLAVLKALRARALLDWDDDVRPANVRIAIGVCAVALFLALPILDFGAISARDQLARLKAGATKASEFDWQAMAFDFGPKGRAALAELAKNGAKDQQTSARTALAAENRWDVADDVQAQTKATLGNFMVDNGGPMPDDALRRVLIRDGQCRKPCRLRWLSPTRVLVVSPQYEGSQLNSEIFFFVSEQEALANEKKVAAAADRAREEGTGDAPAAEGSDAALPTRAGWQRSFARKSADRTATLSATSRIEIRTVTRQQVFVDGREASDLFAPGEIAPE